MRVKVMAMKRWAGTLDGKTIDSAKVFVEVKMDDTRNSADSFATGVATEEIKLPGGEHIRRIEHIPCPFWAEIDTERVSNGKVSRDVVTAIRPIDTAAVKPAAVKAA